MPKPVSTSSRGSQRREDSSSLNERNCENRDRDREWTCRIVSNERRRSTAWAAGVDSNVNGEGRRLSEAGPLLQRLAGRRA